MILLYWLLLMVCMGPFRVKAAEDCGLKTEIIGDLTQTRDSNIPYGFYSNFYASTQSHDPACDITNYKFMVKQEGDNFQEWTKTEKLTIDSATGDITLFFQIIFKATVKITYMLQGEEKSTDTFTVLMKCPDFDTTRLMSLATKITIFPSDVDPYWVTVINGADYMSITATDAQCSTDSVNKKLVLRETGMRVDDNVSFQVSPISGDIKINAGKPVFTGNYEVNITYSGGTQFFSSPVINITLDCDAQALQNNVNIQNFIVEVPSQDQEQSLAIMPASNFISTTSTVEKCKIGMWTLRDTNTQESYKGTDVFFGNEFQLMVVQNKIFSVNLKIEATYGLTTYSTNAFTTSMACPAIQINTGVTNSIIEVPETSETTKIIIKQVSDLGTATHIDGICAINIQLLDKYGALISDQENIELLMTGLFINDDVLIDREVIVSFSQGSIKAQTNVFQVATACPTLTLALQQNLFSVIPANPIVVKREIADLSLLIQVTHKNGACAIVSKLYDSASGKQYSGNDLELNADHKLSLNEAKPINLSSWFVEFIQGNLVQKYTDQFKISSTCPQIILKAIPDTESEIPDIKSENDKSMKTIDEILSVDHKNGACILQFSLSYEGKENFKEDYLYFDALGSIWFDDSFVFEEKLIYHVLQDSTALETNLFNVKSKCPVHSSKDPTAAQVTLNTTKATAENLIDTSYHTKTSKADACMFQKHILLDSSNKEIVSDQLKIGSDGNVTLKVDVKADIKFKIQYEYGGQNFTTKEVQVAFLCTPLNLKALSQEYSLTIPDKSATQRTTVIPRSDYMNTTQSCSATYALLKSPEGTAYTDTWLQISSDGDISVDENTTGSATVSIEITYGGFSNYTTSPFTVKVDCPTLNQTSVPTGTLLSFSFTTEKATQQVMALPAFMSTTSAATSCKLVMSVIDSASSQRADGEEGTFLYIDSQDNLVVNTNILESKTVWIRGNYGGNNYDLTMFDVQVVCPSLALKGINPSTFTYTEPKTDGNDIVIVAVNKYLPTEATCSKSLSVIDSATGATPTGWITLDPNGDLKANLSKSGYMKVKISVSYDGQRYSTTELTVTVLEPAETQSVYETLSEQLNEPPKFNGLFLPSLSVDVVVDSNGKYADDSTFVFTSPQAVDPEENQVVINLDGTFGNGAVSFKVNTDATFNIEVKRKEVTQAFEGSASVVLTDDKGLFTKYPLQVKVSYKVENPPKAEDQLINSFIAEAATLKSEVQKQTLLDEIKALEEAMNSVVQKTKPNGQALTAQEKQAAIDEKQKEVDKKKNDIKLASSGFVKSSGGYNFPGVDISKVDAKSNLKEEEDDAKPKDLPTMSFGAISTDGILSINFNHKMLVPSKFDQSIFDNVFGLKIKSGNDGSVVKGRFNAKKNRRNAKKNRKLQEASSSAGGLKFVPEVTKFQETQLQIKFNFENYKAISSESKDSLILNVMQPELFTSADTGEKINFENLEIPDGVLEMYFPAIVDEETKQNIQATTTRGGDAMSAVSQSNFIITLLMGGSMQQLWGMIRAMQFIVYMGLITYPAPGHTLTFMNGCMMFAAMDIFDGEGLYEKLFQFKQTGPLNDTYELADIGEKNFVMNSGSYFIFFFGIFLFKLAAICCQLVARKCAKYRWARNLGIKSYSSAYLEELKYETVKIFLESYFDLALCAALNWISFFRDADSFSEFLGNFDDSLCTSLTLIHIVLLLIAPFYGFYMIIKHKKELGVLQHNPNMEVYVDGIKLKNLYQAMYNVFFMFRRFITIYVLVFMAVPYFQISALTVLSLINVCYISRMKPLKKNLNVEIFNEICIYIIGIFMASMLNVEWPVDVRDILGWALVMVGGGNILFNLSLTCKQSILDLIGQRRDAKIKQTAKQRLQHKIDNRRKVLEEFPDEFQYFENELKLMEAIKYCKKWQRERKWMIKAHVDFYNFPEELEFQRLVIAYQIKERSYAQRLIKLLHKLSLDSTMKRFTNLQEQARAQAKIDFSDNGSSQFQVKTFPHPLNDRAPSNKTAIDIESEPRPAKEQKRVPKNTLVKRSMMMPMQQIEEEVGEDEKLDGLNLWNSVRHDFDNEQVFNVRQLKGEEGETIINSIFDQEMSCIYKSSLTRNVQKVKSVMPEIDNTRKNKELEKLRKLIQTVKDPQKREELKLVLQEERANYESDIKDPTELRKKKKKFRKTLDSEFMLGKEDNGLEEEVKAVFNQEVDRLLEMHQKNEGMKPMRNAGENDFIQAVLQCLILIDKLVIFFLKRDFDDPDSICEYQLCELLRQVFVDTFQDSIILLKPVQTSISLFPLLTYLAEEFQMPMRGEVDQLMTHIYNQVNAEIQGLSESITVKKDIFRMFTSTIHQKFSCENNHIDSRFSLSNWKLDLDPQDSMEKAFYEYFSPQPIDRLCSQCQCKMMKDIVPVKLAKILVININLFDDDGKSIVEKSQVPLQLDLGKILVDANQKYVYTLFGIINAQGSSKDTVFYEAVTKNKDPDEDEDVNIWVQFLGEKRFVVPISDIIGEQNPKMLFYKLNE